MIDWRLDDGIVTLTIDDPDRRTNTMNAAFERAFAETVERASRTDGLRGIVLTSGKDTFFAGGDLDMLRRITEDDAAELFERLELLKHRLRTLETLGVPVVAAINGAALGGGLELALACHHRIAAEGSYEIGQPEVTLGLLPGAGGVTRITRMLGLQDALTNVLLQGQRMKPSRALAVGIVDAVVPADQLLDQARDWVGANPDARQPWDRDDYRMPEGTPKSPKLAAF